jgi:hypothetical protein
VGGSEFRQLKDRYGTSISRISNSNSDFFTKVLRTFSAAYVRREFWLTEREEELMVSIMNCLADGQKNIFTSGDENNIKKYFSTFKDKKTIQVWLPKLVDKEWIKDLGDGRVILPQEFYPYLKNNRASFVIDLVKILKDGDIVS